MTGRNITTILALALLTLLGGCPSTPTHRAPVQDLKVPPRLAPAAAAEEAPATPPLPGAENAGKPGYYTVRPGDTLIRIALDQGQNWRDLQRWNALDNPNVLEVGQVLRVQPPAPPDPGAAQARAVPPAGRVDSRPLDGAAPAASGPSPAPPPVPSASAAAAPVPPPAASRPPARGVDDDVAWGWPAGGPVIGGFDDARSKGLTIAGKAGDPVLAAADGRVVYVGSDLRGYGNLVIVKHNNTYLSAYAHNQTLLVKDDQVVRRGQKIAEMGASDAERVQLHFEIRRMGVPVDPQKLLPAR
jgi:lipoprotein NlpD